MTEKEYFEDDRWELPEEIKRMSKEELKREIARLEQEIINSKKRNVSQNDIAV